MRKISSILTLLLLCLCGNLSAQTVIARMATLADAATNQNQATPSFDWETNAERGAVYEFSNGNYLGAISNNNVVDAIEGDKYVTVAMWVYGPTTSDQALFGYGDEDTGIKVSLNGNAQKITTKGVNDFEIVTVNANDIQANQWCFVAFTFRGAASTIGDGEDTYRYYTSTTDGHFYTGKDHNLGNMAAVDDASKKLAMGSGDQGNALDAYTGLIANLTVITSDEFLQNGILASLVGPAPTITTTGLCNLINARIKYIEDNYGDGIGYYSISNVEYRIDAARSVMYSPSPTVNQLQEQLDILNSLSVNLPLAGKIYRIVSAYPKFAEQQQGVKKAMYAATETTEGNNPVTANVVKWGDASNDNAYLWAIESYVYGEFKIQNVATSQYMGVWGDPIGDRQILSNLPNSITLTSLGQGQFNIKNGSNVLYTEGHGDGAGESGVIVGRDEGINSPSAWYFEEERSKTPASITYRLKDGQSVSWSNTIVTIKGEPYPPVTGFYNNFVNFPDPPTGTVTGNETVVLEATYNFPFPYGATVATAPTVALDIHGNEAKYPLYYDNNNGVGVEYTAHTDAPDYTQGATKNDKYFWKIVGDPGRGFQIYNVAAAGYIRQSYNADRPLSWSTYGNTFQVYNSTSGIYNAFCFKITSYSYYISHRGEKLQGSTEPDASSSFRAYPVNDVRGSYVHTLNGRYGTICLPFYGKVPPGIKLYSNSSVDANGLLELTEITNPEFIIPGKPYIVEVEAEPPFNFDLGNASKLTSTATTHEGNLYGVLADEGVTVPAGSYVLARNKTTGKQAFFRTNGSVKCPQYKCYLQLPPATTAAKELYFDNEGTTTGIEAIFGGENEEVVIYDLSGKRLSRLQKGVNIVNGHKVIVK